MPEYIEKDSVLEKGAPVPGYFCNMISAWDIVNLPVADVAPVVHGKWKVTPMSGILWCTACGKLMSDDIQPTPFCPFCGAKMDMKD